MYQKNPAREDFKAVPFIKGAENIVAYSASTGCPFWVRLHRDLGEDFDDDEGGSDVQLMVTNPDHCLHHHPKIGKIFYARECQPVPPDCQHAYTSLPKYVALDAVIGLATAEELDDLWYSDYGDEDDE